MADLDLAVPTATEVVVDLRYTGYVVERRPEDFGGAAFAVVQNDARVPRIGVALPMEQDRWQIVLGGYFGAAAPVDPAGARAFAATLATPDLSPLFDRPFLAEPARFTFRSSHRRHWDRLRDLPAGFCVIGDAVASFNPIYGQGMSSAMLQAEALGQAVDRFGNGVRLPSEVARAAAKVADGPWTVATGGDFVYAATTGRRPLGHQLVNGYIDRIVRAAAVDETVNRRLTAVQQMLAAPSSLFLPRVLVRTARLRASATGADRVVEGVAG
jgi:2-polyprenyl-6-methoxyphenol hydroxylase-like FAD-dependent oxidoreductase